MTYKNIKFEDSPVMRSLERLAVNKGLIIPETINKTAKSKASSLEPTENFEENILKLCSALRSSGFEKHATEVESKFFNLKRAQAYTVQKETGEDLVNTAHPDGSHQMKGVDGDALVETIVDTQTAIKKMIAKAPTGKVGTKSLVDFVKNAGRLEKSDAVNAVKIILAQAQPLDEEKLNQLIEANLNRASSLLDAVYQRVESEGDLSAFGNKPGFRIGYASAKKNITTRPATIDNLDKADAGVRAMWNHSSPGALGGIPKDLWRQISGALNTIRGLIAGAKQNREKVVDILGKKQELGENTTGLEMAPEKLSPSVTLPTTVVSPGKLFTKLQEINPLVNKLIGAKAVGSISSNRDIMKWIDEEIAALKDISRRYGGVPEDQEEAILPALEKELEAEKSDIARFYQTWVLGQQNK